MLVMNEIFVLIIINNKVNEKQLNRTQLALKRRNWYGRMINATKGRGVFRKVLWNMVCGLFLMPREETDKNVTVPVVNGRDNPITRWRDYNQATGIKAVVVAFRLRTAEAHSFWALSFNELLVSAFLRLVLLRALSICLWACSCLKRAFTQLTLSHI